MNSRLFPVSDGDGTPIPASESRAGNESFDLNRYEAEMRALDTQLKRVVEQARAARHVAREAREATTPTRLA